MKPDKITCQNCGKQIQKGKWCSDKCRMALKRQGEQKPEHSVPEHEQMMENIQPEQKFDMDEDSRATLTKTDQTFFDRAMEDFGEPYYNFNSSVQEKSCTFCGKRFTTMLSMNKNCSYEHYSQSLAVFRG